VGGRFQLTIEAIGKSYGRSRVLSGVDLTIEAGQVTALSGLNGSGKSTLIKILTGVIQPDAGGTIRLNGELLGAITPQRARRLGVHVIFQDLALFPNLSAAENIAIEASLAAPFGWRRRGRARAIATAALERLGAEVDLDAAVEDLPIAERQIVAIARALASEARFLILDEPTASLTAREVERLLGVVAALRAEGVAALFVSHRYSEVARVADNVIALRDGRVVGRFTPDTLSEAGLNAAIAGDVALAAGRAVANDAGPIILQARALTRRGEFADVDLTVRAGEVIGVTGRLGSGRTELAETLFGLRRPDSGEIRIDGAPRRFRSNRDAIAAGIAYVPEDRARLGLILEASVADNIVLAGRRRWLRRGGRIDHERTRALAAELIRRLGVRPADPEAPVSSLSGGNQQRVALAKWLALQPRLLVLDAPTVGVDVAARQALYRVIRETAGSGAGVILISDEIEEVRSNAERVFVMRAGRLTGPYLSSAMSEAGLWKLVHA
jgi:simple sugar transport system ATP-binding protein